MKRSKAPLTPIYQGHTCTVWPRAKRDGTTAYILTRPESRSAVMDQFDDIETAVQVARYIDAHGGSYDSAHRHAAIKAANLAWME